MNRAAIIAKVRKCLALAASDNEHEAALALERARALMAEHGIADDDVALADVSSALGRGGGANKPPAWENILAASVGRALDCRVIYSYHPTDFSRRWEFVGVGASAEIAAYAWSVLYRQLRQARTAYLAGPLKRCRPTRKRQRADIFCQAWALAVYDKVKHLAPSPAVQALLTASLDRRSGQLRTLEHREAKADNTPAVANDYHRGKTAGQRAELHAGVGGAAQARIGA